MRAKGRSSPRSGHAGSRAHEEEREGLGPEHADSRAAQEDAADDLGVVAQGDGVGHELDRRRHVVDREDEAREVDHRHHRPEGRTHHGLLLVLHEGGDQEAEAEGAEDEEGGEGEKERERAPQGHAEAEDGDRGGEAHLEKADEGEGEELPHEQLPRPDRGDDDLLEGADLLLPHHPHRGEQHGHDHEDHGEHGGDVEPPALEVRVVEDARDEDGLAGARCGGRAGAPAALLHLGAQLAGEGRGVAERDVGGGGVAAVHDQLDASGAPRGEGGAEALTHDEPELGLRGDEPAVHLAGALRGAHDLEVARLDEAAHQVAARRAAVLVDEDGRDVGDVGVHGEAEDEDLHDRGHEDDRDHPSVSADLEELLDDDAPQDVHVRPPAGRGAARRAPPWPGRRERGPPPAASRWRCPRP